MMLMRICYTGLVFMWLFFTSCNDTARQTGATHFLDTSKYPRLYVDSRNNVKLNGRAVDIRELEQKFIEVEKDHGWFSYSSDSASEEPPRSGPVFQLFKKYRVGIQMYTDSTFQTSY
jgi:hypothetical protein